MRNRGFSLFAVTSMVALLFGGQLCMLGECSAQPAQAAAHDCCAKTAEESSNTKTATGIPESARPCCIQVTPSSVPALEPPAAPAGHVPAALVVAVELAATPARVEAPRAPVDVGSPPLPDLPCARGERAPPISA